MDNYFFIMANPNILFTRLVWVLIILTCLFRECRSERKATKLEMECSLKRTDEENCSRFEKRIETCYKGLIVPF